MLRIILLILILLIIVIYMQIIIIAITPIVNKRITLLVPHDVMVTNVSPCQQVYVVPIHKVKFIRITSTTRTPPQSLTTRIANLQVSSHVPWTERLVLLKGQRIPHHYHRACRHVQVIRFVQLLQARGLMCMPSPTIIVKKVAKQFLQKTKTAIVNETCLCDLMKAIHKQTSMQTMCNFLLK